MLYPFQLSLTNLSFPQGNPEALIMETRHPDSGLHILSHISSLSISASAYSRHPSLCISLAVKATLELTLAVLAQ